MSKLNLRIWPRTGLGEKWTVQYRPRWSPFWWTVGKYENPDEARKAIKELQKDRSK